MNLFWSVSNQCACYVGWVKGVQSSPLVHKIQLLGSKKPARNRNGPKEVECKGTWTTMNRGVASLPIPQLLPRRPGDNSQQEKTPLSMCPLLAAMFFHLVVVCVSVCLLCILENTQTLDATPSHQTPSFLDLKSHSNHLLIHFQSVPRGLLIIITPPLNKKKTVLFFRTVVPNLFLRHGPVWRHTNWHGPVIQI